MKWLKCQSGTTVVIDTMSGPSCVELSARGLFQVSSIESPNFIISAGPDDFRCTKFQAPFLPPAIVDQLLLDSGEFKLPDRDSDAMALSCPRLRNDEASSQLAAVSFSREPLCLRKCPGRFRRKQSLRTEYWHELHFILSHFYELDSISSANISPRQSRAILPIDTSIHELHSVHPRIWIEFNNCL
jgi:hypothetical protein